MALASLQSDRTWGEAQRDLQDVMRKWDKEFMPPILKQTQQDQYLTVRYVVHNQWVSVSSRSWVGQRNWEARNLIAVVQALDAVRKAEQRGLVGLLAEVVKYHALPSGDWDPRRELGVSAAATAAELRAAYLNRAKLTHPDSGGTDESFRRVQKAAQELGVA
jgi:hypothetical protein